MSVIVTSLHTAIDYITLYVCGGYALVFFYVLRTLGIIVMHLV